MSIASGERWIELSSARSKISRGPDEPSLSISATKVFLITGYYFFINCFSILADNCNLSE